LRDAVGVEVAKVVVGQDDALDALLVALAVGAELDYNACDLGEEIVVVATALHEALAPYVTARGVVLPGAAWLVTARA